MPLAESAGKPPFTVLCLTRGLNHVTKELPMRTLILIAAAFALAACNTVSGAGKDVSSVGKAVTKTAEDVKN